MLPLTLSSVRMGVPLRIRMRVQDGAGGERRGGAAPVGGRCVQITVGLDVGEAILHGVAYRRRLQARSRKRLLHAAEPQRKVGHGSDRDREAVAAPVAIERQL